MFITNKRRILNFNKEVVDCISQSLGLEMVDEAPHRANGYSPYDLLDYIYAVLYSPKYRERYEEYLKLEFPRIPYPTNQVNFWRFVKFGRELRNIHLFKNNEQLSDLAESFPFIGKGNNTIEKTPGAAFKDGKIYFNKSQFIDGVSEEQWKQYIGGYQPLQKWLKDRKGLAVSDKDILHYRKMISALRLTADVMREISYIEEFV